MKKPYFTLFIIISLFFFTDSFCQNLNLKIKGKTETETKTLDSIGYNKVHENYLSIKNEIDSLKTSLDKIGYIDHKLIELKKLNDTTFTSLIHVKEKFNSIHIYYDHIPINKTLLNSISNNVTEDYFSINFKDIENILNTLNFKLANEGNPFSKLKLINITKKDSSNLRADLSIVSKKQKRIIDNIKIIGYENFPKSYLNHFLKLKTSQTFNLEKVNKKTAQLTHLIFASQTKSPEVLFKKDSTTLYLYIEKLKKNSFDGFLGFGTNDETNKIEFDGFLNLKLVNNLNYGETFGLLYKSDENDQQTFNIAFNLPYIFSSPVGLDLNLRIFRKDSTFTTVDQKLKVNYQINPLNKVSLGVASTTSNNLLSSSSNFNNLENYKSNYYLLSFEYIKPQYSNLLFPVKRTLYFESGLGNRDSNNNTTQQTLVNIKAFNSFSLNLKNSIYFNINASTLISENYFENELLRFGGINSIRGFEENSLFASLFGVLNAEYRYSLSKSIYIHTITDVAYMENESSNTKEKLFGYGFGFGILTKSGLLKFNYANGKNNNQKFKLSNSKIHISLTTNF